MPKMPNIPSIPNIPKVPNIPSINPTAQAVKEQSAPATNSETPQQPISEENRPFTLDQLYDAWAGLKSIFVGEPRLLAVLAEHRPQLIDEEHCELTLANPWQQNEFKKHGKKAMDHIRKVLHNSKLQLTLKVAEFDTSHRAYTAEEKYKVLIGLNPELANLKSSLGLQLE